MSAAPVKPGVFSGGDLPQRVVIRNRFGQVFRGLCYASTWVGLVVLVVLLAGVLWQGWGWLDWQFLSSYDSFRPKNAGILAGIWGSLWLMALTGLFAVPVGVGAAVYLEEYAKGTWLTRMIQVNLSNLAGVPSIVYGILGLTVFVRMFGLFTGRELGLLERTVAAIIRGPAGVLGIPLPFGSTVISGALTLSLLVLPVVIIATQEALRAVPPSIRHASYALGATKWQTIRHQVLPAAIPGILTGVILALSRAVGETAPLIMLGIPTYLKATPGGIDSVGDLFRDPKAALEAPFTTFTALPMIIFNWVKHPKEEFKQLAAAGIVVLLALLLLMNSSAILIRQRFQKRIRW